jgi:hypothetical protein
MHSAMKQGKYKIPFPGITNGLIIAVIILRVIAS